MSFDEYKAERMAYDKELAADYEKGYEDFKLGVLLCQAREDAGMSLEDVSDQTGLQTSIISKIETHAEDVRLSLLRRYADVFGMNIRITLA